MLQGRRGLRAVGRLAKVPARAALRLMPSRVSVLVVVAGPSVGSLPELLGDLEGQSRPPREVLLLPVADGPVDGLERLVPSARVLAPRGDVQDAVRSGVAAAKGALVLVLDARDRLRPVALEALGNAVRPGVDLVGATWHDLGRRGLGDVLVSRRLWRRVDPVVTDENAAWAPVVELLVHARRAVDAPAARSDNGSDPQAFGAVPVLAPSVPGWAAAVERLLALVREEPQRRTALSWLADEELPRFLLDAERCTGDQWTALCSVCRLVVSEAPADVLAGVRVESRVRVLLAAGRHREALERFNAATWLVEDQFPTVVTASGVVEARLPVEPELLPPGATVLGEADTALVAQLRAMRWAGDELEVDVLAALRHVPEVGGSVALAWVSSEGKRLRVETSPAPDPDVNVVVGDRFVDHSQAVVRGRVAVDDLLAGERWHLEVTVDRASVRRHGRVADVDPRGSAPGLPTRSRGGRGIGVADNGLTVVVGPDDGPRRPAAGRDWAVASVVLDSDVLELGGVAPTGADGAVALEVAGPAGVACGELVATAGRFTARVPLRREELGQERLLAPGTYRFRRGGQDLAAAPDLVASVPVKLRSEVFRARVRRGRDGAALLVLSAPLADDEAGPYAQTRLQERFVAEERRVDPGVVYLQSYTGQVTDSPLAIHDELRRSRPDLRLVWAVADRSVEPPPGAASVLYRSRAWYDALASAGSLVVNVDLDPWFRKRPGQRVLQTYHGYPSKTMGISAWTAKNFTSGRIARQLSRTSGTWDLLLAPNDEMAEHYRREYAYAGEILAEGYPRDDALLAPSADDVRVATRERLGVPPDARLVLYAPTWRDDLATNFRAAATTDDFDLAAASRALGAGYVIALRGHRFHRNRPDVDGRHVIDVTTYPEINDLVLAADVAVLDYSSLRFEMALVEKPMVFLVPDLDRYENRVRGFLYDFRSSAPGPLVSSTEEVVDALRDLERLRRTTGPDLARFNARFNDRQDGHAAERVVRAFFGPPPGATATAGTVTGL